MTSREIIQRVLRHDHPPRIGLTLPAPYPDDLMFKNIAPPAGWVEPVLPSAPGEHRRWKDEWGSTWASLWDFIGGEVVEPAISDWSQLASYRAPDLGDPSRYRDMQIGFSGTDKFRIGSLRGFVFATARYIRKLENYLGDLLLERENIDRLHAIVKVELFKAVDRLAQAGADAVMIYEDWGTQDRLMISPALWREMYKPDFVQLCRAVHDRGMFMFMHSCGKITDIIPDLVEVGIDCLQFDQPLVHGLDTLARFHDKVTFWSPVDIQRTLQTRDPAKIRADARAMIEKLGQGGGFIGGYYTGNAALGITPEVQDHACRAFMEFADQV